MSPTGTETVKNIAVLLVEGQHGVLSDMVRDVLEHAPGIDVVGDVTEIAETADVVERTGCDAVVWVVPAETAAIAPHDLLRRHPTLRIVVVESRGEQGSVWRMRPTRTRLDLLSPESIIEELSREP